MIDVNPEDLLLVTGDLPAEANYYLVGTRSRGKTSNSAILIEMGAGPGQEYIDHFGRVAGWYISLTRGSFSSSAAPEFVDSGVTLFRTHEGAMKFLEETHPDCHIPEDGTATKIESSIGDASLTCLSTFLDLSGRTRYSYGVNFVYRNVYEYVYGSSWVDELHTEDVDLLVDLLMSRLQDAQLSDQVSVTP